MYFRVKPTLRTPSGRRCRKSRTVFTDLQLRVLEKTFAEQKYLDTSNRAKLAQTLGLNETQVKTWFQNRRMKWKKESVPANNQESSTSRNEDSNAPGDEKSDEIVAETGKASMDKKVEWTAKTKLGIKLCKYPREISISILLESRRTTMILEFNMFHTETHNYEFIKIKNHGRKSR